MRPTLHGYEDQRTLAQLFSDLTHESSELVRKEVELAKLELAESVSELKTGIASMMISVPVLFAGLLCVVFAGVLALDEALHRPWLSALLVGVALMAAGAIALLGGRAKLARTDVKPQRSVASLRDDKEMVQRHVGSDPH
jgi:uncharacterized membrane protein YqjE